MTAAHRAARSAGSIARADSGSQASRICLYTASGGTLLAVVELAQPCASVRPSDGRIQLLASSAPVPAVASGVATWAEWQAGDGQALSVGQVTDEAGNISDGMGGTTPTGDVGPWVLAGTSGTQLYEGGLVWLTTGIIG